MSCNNIFEKEFELYLRDTDKNNKMRFSSYLNLMQEIGGMHASQIGHGLKEEIKTGKAWIVIAWKLDIFKRPSWNENLKVRTWIGKVDKIYHYRDYELLDSNNEVVAKGVAQWVMVDTINNKIMKAEESCVEEFNVIEREDFDNNIKKINARVNIDNANQIFEYVIQKRDTDKNNHMNNVIYLDLALEGLEDKVIDRISSIEIHYKTECKYGDKITFFSEEIDGQTKIYIMDENKEKLHSQVILK